MKTIFRTIILISFLFICLPFCKADNLLFTAIDASDGLSDNQVRYILQLHDGRMVFTTNGNLNLYDGTNFTYIHRSPQHIFPIEGYRGHYRIYQQGDSLLWIKEMGKLMCVDLRKERYVEERPTCLSDTRFTDEVKDLFVDSRQRLWLLRGDMLTLPDDPSSAIDLSAQTSELQDLWADGESLYLFYDTGVVTCFDLATQQPLYATNAYPEQLIPVFDKTSLVVKGPSGLYQLRNGRKGGFFLFDPEERTWQQLLETDYALNTLIVTPDDKSYVSCANGLWIVDCASGAKQYIPSLRSVDGRVFDTEISTLFQDAQGGLWLGTLNRGLLYYHPHRYKFDFIGNSYFTNDHKDFLVEAFAEDVAGRLYLQTNHGYYSYQKEKGHQLSPLTFMQLPREVQHAFNRYDLGGLTLVDSRGWQWTGTQDGLFLRKSSESTPIVYHTEDGLVNGSIRALLEDLSGDVWVTTSYGITRVVVSGEAIQFINYNPYDGTLSGEYANGSAFQTNDGTLCFGGVNGFNLVRPHLLDSSSMPLSPVFTALSLRGERVAVGQTYEGRVLLPQSTAFTQQITLAHNENFLTLEFSAPNYRNPSQTSYRYQLEGLDADWQEMTSRTKDGKAYISYTALPSGSYTFRIKASDSYDWTGDERRVEIVVLTPWWRTTWAYILYLLLSLSLASFIFYLYQRRMREKIEQKHKEDLLLLRVKNLIEQCNLLEAERIPKAQEQPTDEPKEQNPDEAAFISRAIELVEKNLYESNYSVEQLSRDLCMDRTGLYRKLVAAMNQTPSLFIRSIRLQKAAQLLAENELSITEISDRLGFSTPSYMSKCFQEAYGCRPSEYTKKQLQPVQSPMK